MWELTIIGFGVSEVFLPEIRKNVFVSVFVLRLYMPKITILIQMYFIVSEKNFGFTLRLNLRTPLRNPCRDRYTGKASCNWISKGISRFREITFKASDF
jgi:hypothetical protein